MNQLAHALERALGRPDADASTSQRTKFRRQCSGKVRHASAEAADTEVNRLRRYSRRYAAYQCRWCGYWHCGRQRLDQLQNRAATSSLEGSSELPTIE